MPPPPFSECHHHLPFNHNFFIVKTSSSILWISSSDSIFHLFAKIHSHFSLISLQKLILCSSFQPYHLRTSPHLFSSFLFSLFFTTKKNHYWIIWFTSSMDFKEKNSSFWVWFCGLFYVITCVKFILI